MIKAQYKSGILTVSVLNNGIVHSDKGPAVRIYNFTGSDRTFMVNNLSEIPDPGQVIEEHWYKNGFLHNETGPAMVKYDHKGNISTVRWYYLGIEKSLDKNEPSLAYRSSDTYTETYKNEGICNNETHPNYYYLDKKISENRYFKEGRLHSDKGPAYISTIENIWFKDNLVHNSSGPALIEIYFNGKVKRKEWRINGLLHRDNEPARIDYSITGKVERELFCSHGEVIKKL